MLLPGKKARLAVAVAASGRFPVKVVADTLGVARSNLVEQRAGGGKRRGRYQRQGDGELLTAIRQLTDARPTYGYRRITAFLNRARRAAGAGPVNHKRVFRVMAQAKLLLQPHVGLRLVRAHEGQVIALASNQRWSSDALEISCWNGEVIRLAFAIDTCDREIIAWQASTGGISGDMVRNLMLACVEKRFNALRASYPVQWLADNGFAYAARQTIEFAAALSLVPCFTPVRSPESNGVSEAYVKTLKHDYAPDPAPPGRPDRSGPTPNLHRRLQRKSPTERLAHALTP